MPVVRLLGEGLYEETGEACAIALAHMGNRHRLLVAIIDGGGMAPYVTVDDRVVFDPDDREPGEAPRIVLLRYRRATLAAWHRRIGAVFAFWHNEGALDTDLCDVAGAIIYTMKLPPPAPTDADG